MVSVDKTQHEAFQPVLQGEAVQKYKLPTLVLGATASPDGKIVYASCLDGVYRLDTSEPAKEKLYAHDSYASGAMLLEATGMLITAGYDGNLIWYDLERGKQVRKIKAHDFWSWKSALAPDQSMVASVSGQYLAGDYDYRPRKSEEPTVKVFDTTTGQCLHAFDHLPSVQSVAFSHGNRFLAAGNLMGGVRVWDLETGKLLSDWVDDGFTSWGVIKSHCYIGGIHGLDFNQDDSEILATGFGPMRDPMAGNGKQLWQRWKWNQPTPEKVAEKQQGTGLMESIVLHPSGRFFAMAGKLRDGDANLSLFDITNNERVAHANVGFRVTEALYAADGSQLMVVGGVGQPLAKHGKVPEWGRVHVYDLKAQPAG